MHLRPQVEPPLYPERLPQAALGHNSKAVHRASAKHAKVVLPSLASFEKNLQQGKILPLQEGGSVAAEGVTSCQVAAA